MTLRRAFPRAFRLLLTLLSVLLVGFYGVTRAARQTSHSGWAFSGLPTFVNRTPEDVRSRSLAALRLAAGTDERAFAARAELVRLGGAALPFVLPALDSLEPGARGQVALSLSPVARRMGVAAPEELANEESALSFFSRFWQDRSIEFRPQVVRRAVQRLAERSLGLRREDVIHADTFALPDLIEALGKVQTQADVERVRRLQPVLMHITGRGLPLPANASVSDARLRAAAWRGFWLERSSDFIELSGPRRVAAFVTETQFGKWLRLALEWKLGQGANGRAVLGQVLESLPRSACFIAFVLGFSLLLAVGSALRRTGPDLGARLRERIGLACASLVASHPMVMTLALGAELFSGIRGALTLCAESLRLGDVTLCMGVLLGLTLLSELMVTVPAGIAGQLAPPEAR